MALGLRRLSRSVEAGVGALAGVGPLAGVGALAGVPALGKLGNNGGFGLGSPGPETGELTLEPKSEPVVL